MSGRILYGQDITPCIVGIGAVKRTVGVIQPDYISPAVIRVVIIYAGSRGISPILQRNSLTVCGIEVVKYVIALILLNQRTAILENKLYLFLFDVMSIEFF